MLHPREFSQYTESSRRRHQRWNAKHHVATPLMKIAIVLIFALASHCHGQPAIVPPQLGFVQDSTHSCGRPTDWLAILFWGRLSPAT